MLTCPKALSGTTTRFGIVTPAFQFRFDAVGCDWSEGHTVRKLDVFVSVAVTFNTTAVAPAGTPLVPPVTCSIRVAPGPSGAWVAPSPERVSRTRLGDDRAWYIEPVVPSLSN